MMLYNQTGSTVWLFKGHPIAAWGGSDVPGWLAESPGVQALIAAGTLGSAAPDVLPPPPPVLMVDLAVPSEKASKKLGKK